MLSQAFATVVANLKTFVVNFTRNGDKETLAKLSSVPPATPSEIRDTAAWLQKEKFLNFSDLEISIPMGLNVHVMDYVKILEQVWSDYLVNLGDDLLAAVSSNVGIVANDENLAKERLTIRTLNTRYPFYKKDPQSAKDLMAKCMGGGRKDKCRFGSVFNSATEYEATMLRVLALRDQVGKQEVNRISRSLETISASVDTILDYQVDPKLAEHLSDELMNASKWVEFYGVYLLALDELSNSLGATHEKIKNLSKK